MQRYLLLFKFLPTQQARRKKSRVAFAGFSLIFFARSSEMIHQKTKLIYFYCKLQITIRREENFHFIF